MIEKTVRDYLAAAFEDVPVYLEKPEEKPGKYIVLQKTGGGITNRVRRATMAVQSYADSKYEASALNEQVLAVMDCLPELNIIGRCSLNSEYDYTDVSTKKYRYQAVFDLNYYEEV